MEEKVQNAIKKHSDANIDDYVRTTLLQGTAARGMRAPLRCIVLLATSREHSTDMQFQQSIRGHIHLELQGWFFFRKLAADCSRSNIALHGFGA